MNMDAQEINLEVNNQHDQSNNVGRMDSFVVWCDPQKSIAKGQRIHGLSKIFVWGSDGVYIDLFGIRGALLKVGIILDFQDFVALAKAMHDWYEKHIAQP